VKDKSYYNETVQFMLETMGGTLKKDLTMGGTLKKDLSRLNLMFS